MSKKSVVAFALLFAAAGLILANTVKAQDTTADNSAMNSDNGGAAAPADQ
ncbi:MAG: hypothetical protein KGJ09_03070 [Candidatus Omnitrophica bacterium]|nr:hypothetical protein [Candidatus Omnitrophota bacterium]MDE2009042.1 hypothetical protein [Candidatus Omnitrophota bacterium]MDE2214293.1 hypothetical protein [Candidatus Omnitrophota bacterium]MDE2231330.1 hypothetical protein [Candidatus Omnitrophota bacterium]